MFTLLIDRITRSLTSKLVIAISLFMLLGGALLLLLVLKGQRQEFMEEAHSHAVSFSEVTQRSIRYDMLAANMGNIRRTLQSISESESVFGICIIGRNGTIRHSSLRQGDGQTSGRLFYPCTDCHENTFATLTNRLPDKREWVVHEAEPGGYRVLTLLDPIYNAPDCYTAQCHFHNGDEKVLGFLLTDYSLKKIDRVLAKNALGISVYLSIVVLAIALILSLILWAIVLKPFSSFSFAMKRIAAGDLSHRINITSEDELGRLARTFNEMAEELSLARQRADQWTETLEEEVEKQTRVIKETQDKLIQAEKMAALGRLTAEIAHQIRNPLTALGGFGRRLLKLASTTKEKQYAGIVVAEANRLERILRDVLVLSWKPQIVFERQPLTETVRTSVALFHDQCAEHHIAVRQQLEAELPVLLEKEHIRQAIDNLITNALDAMAEGGTLTITTQREFENNATYVALHVRDTGPGIPEQDLDQVVEPFYTTKKIGKGTGLGLAIARKIIIEHGGFIRIRNNSDHGVTVSLYFPFEESEDPSAATCWEYMQCGRDRDHNTDCPAFPHFGRICWAVAGTMCPGKVHGAFAQKLEDCKLCEFYREMHDKGG